MTQWQTKERKDMSNLVEAGLAKGAAIVGVGAGLCGLGNVICGFIWLGHNGYGGHGLWSGFGVSLLFHLCFLKNPSLECVLNVSC